MRSSPQPEEEDGPLYKALAFPRFGGRRSHSETCKSIFSIISYLLLTKTKFIDRFNELNKASTIPLPQKMRASSKPGHYNVNDTDTESDADNDQVTHATSTWVDEWKLYLNTYEVVPDNLGLVLWWGVSA